MKKFAKYISLLAVCLMTVLCFAACVPSDVDSAIDKMESAGYVVSEPVITAAEQNAGVVGKIKAQKLDSHLLPTDTIIAVFFNSKEDAKKFYESNSGWLDSVLTKSGYDGKWAFAASSDAAINDFKK